MGFDDQGLGGKPPFELRGGNHCTNRWLRLRDLLLVEQRQQLLERQRHRGLGRGGFCAGGEQREEQRGDHFASRDAKNRFCRNARTSARSEERRVGEEGRSRWSA